MDPWTRRCRQRAPPNLIFLPLLKSFPMEKLRVSISISKLRNTMSFAPICALLLNELVERSLRLLINSPKLWGANEGFSTFKAIFVLLHILALLAELPFYQRRRASEHKRLLWIDIRDDGFTFLFTAPSLFKDEPTGDFGNPRSEHHRLRWYTIADVRNYSTNFH